MDIPGDRAPGWLLREQLSRPISSPGTQEEPGLQASPSFAPFPGGAGRKGRGFRHPQGQIGPAVVRQKPRLTQGEGASAEYRGEEAELRLLEDSEEGVKSGPAAESRT